MFGNHNLARSAALALLVGLASPGPAGAQTVDMQAAMQQPAVQAAASLHGRSRQAVRRRCARGRPHRALPCRQHRTAIAELPGGHGAGPRHARRRWPRIRATTLTDRIQAVCGSNGSSYLSRQE
jgi:hypothetical protein